MPVEFADHRVFFLLGVLLRQCWVIGLVELIVAPVVMERGVDVLVRRDGGFLIRGLVERVMRRMAVIGKNPGFVFLVDLFDIHCLSRAEWDKAIKMTSVRWAAGEGQKSRTKGAGRRAIQ